MPTRPSLLPPLALLLALSTGCGMSKLPGPPMSPSRAGMARPASAAADATVTGGMNEADDSGGSARAESAPEAPPAPPPPPPGDLLAQAPGAAKKDEARDVKPEPPRPDGRDAGKIVSQRAPVLIYTGNFGLAVFDVAASIEATEKMAVGLGGFVARRTNVDIVVRVPAARFDEAVARIDKLGEVTRRQVEAQDVTEEFLDVEIRLRNARAVRDRLAQLLAKSTTVQDSLMIERELNRVAGEIDRLEGRLKYLRDRAAFSTLTVSFANRRSDSPPPSVRLPFSWLRVGGLSQLLSL